MHSGFVLNFSLLVSVSVLSGVLADLLRERPKLQSWAQGILFGSIALLLMAYRVEFGGGIFFDGRTGVLFLGSCFFGAPAALISTGMALTYRFCIGGDGMWIGMASIFLSPLAGLLYFRGMRPETRYPDFFELLRGAAVLHFILVILFFAMLPLEMAMGVWWIFLLVMPLTTAFAGKLISMQLKTPPLLDSLKTQDQRLRMITENMREVFWVMDLDTLKFSYVSHSGLDYTGYTTEESLQLGMEDILTPDSYAEVLGWMREELSGLHDPLKAAEFSRRLRRIEERCKDGSTVWSEISMSVIHDRDHKPVKILGISRNITERVHMEEALQRSLSEKEALLKEVHHRVKNNLQVITSILRLEANRNDHPYTREVLSDMRRRIRSIALLHEMVYQTGGFAAVNMRVYLGKLLRQVSMAMSPSLTKSSTESDTPAWIETKLEADALEFPMEKAIPCGLLANELLSNAYKHAFSPGEKGLVTLVLRKSIEPNTYELYVTDTGQGLPEDFDPRGQNSLGMQLISDLSTQLDGSLILERQSPARVGVRFRFSPNDKNPD